MYSNRSAIIWALVTTSVIVPLLLAANSPLLQWRDPVYKVAGFCGVLTLALLLLQPLLACNQLPGINNIHSKRLHRIIGTTLVVTITIHITGLWITSPPDVVDALLFRSATPFSIWGVAAMWGVILTSVLVVLRKRTSIPPRIWKFAHKALATIIVTGTVVHAVLIDGTMETISKVVLCILLLSATLFAITKTSSTKSKI